MDLTTFLIIATVISVFIFDFTNGFHDSADMVATAIASRAMRTSTAIALVSIFTFLGPLIAGLAVADTVGTFVNISNAPLRDAQALVIAALLAAVTYNLITWRFGLPSSSSNSLAGGLVGAGLFIVGNTQINWGIEAMQHGELTGVMKVVAGLFASPFLGFIIGFLIMKLIFFVFKRFTMQIRPLFVISQYFSVSWLGFSHGANDAQKGMAIIGMMLLASHETQTFTIPLWVILMCTTAITLGTMFGGWSIIKTLGFELYHVKLIHSVANQLGAALVNTLATAIGAPTSTTQVVTATLLGNGAAEKPSHVGWKRAGEIILGWLINVPVSMGFGALYSYLLIKILGVFS
ncbi:inorganic phosphate transporter [Sulfurimonas paralvinellae]|uniref:Inorganic phosphate transporter n=1 Tax=Sulfurimonas paralvinellae TaxID=317658 RepID=A0A7M1B824_9BACT|nr:inorganic phosphate transporter [Sulfurimonas paralvinellae]QOP45899.1 inorganic phosphate transporter [Sulfurimonas paralvinellae]